MGAQPGPVAFHPSKSTGKNLGWEARQKHPKQLGAVNCRTPESMHHTGTGQERGGAESVEVIRKVIARHTNYVFCNRNI